MRQLTLLYIVFQTIGGAYAVSSAQSGFVNRIITTLASSAPGVDPQMVIATGATNIRKVFAPSEVPGIVIAYMAGLKVAFALVIGLVGFSCLVALLVPWKPINREPQGESGGVVA